MTEDHGAAAVLLDLDGTLINTKRLYIECYREAVLPHLGRELTTEEILALRPRSEFRFMRDVVGETKLQACMNDFYRAYDRLHDDYFGGVYPGVPEMLDTLRTRGTPIGIVTGKSRRSWELTTARAPLGDFDALIFDDDVDEPKPDPQGLRRALEMLRARPERSVYLGDSVSDIEAARAAGMRPAAALWARKPEDHAAFLERVTPLGAEAFATPQAFVDAIRAGVPSQT